MKILDRIIVIFLNFTGGPDEEFPSEKYLNRAAVVIGFFLAVVIGMVML